MAMNRYNYVIGIALGRIPIEESKIELSEEELKRIESIRKERDYYRSIGQEVTFYAPESYE